MRIVWDTETTGFPVKGGELEVQPYIIEFGGIVTDDNFQPLDEFETLIKPIHHISGETVPIPADASASNKIYDVDVADALPFAAHFPRLAELFFGCKRSYAHNHQFDKQMMVFATQRIGRVTFFPWPPEQICTVQETKHLNKGRYFKLEKLYEYLFEEEKPTVHRALADAHQLLKVCQELQRREIID